jgi:hypothetical protein
MDRRQLNIGIGGVLFQRLCNPSNVLADQIGGGVKNLLDKGLVPKHPRLHLRAEQWLLLRSAIRTNSQLARWYAFLQQHCNELLDTPPAAYRLIGPRLLSESRKALDTISCLAAVYRLDGDLRKANRARQELVAICSFPDWHPSHFLDVAEMTNAAALGYDWLFDILTVDERKLVREKIVQFGLNPGLQAYYSKAWWTLPGTNNWGIVCNGGLTIGALAVAGEVKEAGDVVSQSVTNIRHALANYGPDGGWPEGPDYWHYATFYMVSMISALESALRFDFGLADWPGFSKTGWYRARSIGPIRLLFNYGDADPEAKAGSSPETLWLARRFQQPYWTTRELEIIENNQSKPEIFHMLWTDLHAKKPILNQPPLDAKFDSIDVVFLRSSWADSRAIFVCAKGGNNRASHGHLDLGSFVLDGKGQRWALDLGRDDYDLPGYFNSEGPRWQYYRLRTEAHNTLCVASQNQAISASAPLIAFSSGANVGSVTIDLSAAYAPYLSAVKRTITIDRMRMRVIVDDFIKSEANIIVRWNLHTAANATIEGPLAILDQHDERISVRILKPDNASFKMSLISPAPPQAQNNEVSTLSVDLVLSGKDEHLSIMFDLA